MRILFDHGTPSGIAKALPGHWKSVFVSTSAEDFLKRQCEELELKGLRGGDSRVGAASRQAEGGIPFNTSSGIDVASQTACL